MIGFLDTYYLENNPNSYQRTYGKVFEKHLSTHFSNQQIQRYQVALGELPTSVAECDIWFVGGSSKSCTDSDNWIHNLKKFIIQVQCARVKMVGFCFGHQLIAAALGGEVKKSAKGWGAGVRSFKVLDSTFDFEGTQSLQLIYSHQDQVTQLPPGAKHLGTSDFCEFEMFMVEESTLCFQGHPEFCPEFALERYKSRQSALGPAVFNQALKTINNPTSAESVWKYISQKF